MAALGFIWTAGVVDGLSVSFFRLTGVEVTEVMELVVVLACLLSASKSLGLMATICLANSVVSFFWPTIFTLV